MKSYLDCIPCFMRQVLEVARMATDDPGLHEQILRESFKWIDDFNLQNPPPVMGQFLHRRLREITGKRDPYQSAKEKQNRLALELLPGLRRELETTDDPLALATRLAIAGNIIDLGVNGNLTEGDVLNAVYRALKEPLVGDWEIFRTAIGEARDILYLADNAGEIVFDRLLIEQILPKPVTVAVRGAPVINDALRIDAQAAGLDQIVEVVDNGSDIPGTVLTECSPAFQERFAAADLIIAKGQGNFETLSDEPHNIFFLFKIKCPVIAAHIGQPVGTQILLKSNAIPSGTGSDR